MLKFYLYFDNVSIGIKFDNGRKVLHVGGYKKDQLKVRVICEHYFRLDMKKAIEHWSQINKVRYIGDLTLGDFVKGKRLLEENGFTLIETETLDIFR